MIGKLINDRYQVNAEIGQGGMGTVYRAHDSVLDRDVALKLVTSLKLGTEGRSRLLTEARTVAKLAHPDIVTVFDAGEVDDQPFVVMEFIQGKTLAVSSVDGFKAIVGIANQICAALDYAHAQGIVHRAPRTTRFPPHSAVRSSIC